MSIVVVAGFLAYSDSLVAELSAQERSRMQIWADATTEIANMAASETDGSGTTMDFLLSIIEDNHSIPVLLTDAEGNILNHRNFRLPEQVDETVPFALSTTNARYLEKKLAKMRETPNVIEIRVADRDVQYLYYEDSKLLRTLSYFPYVQVAVLLAFVLIVYYAVSSTKRAEQNKVWVGLSKETAHQLGTPISSLMAWMELLPALGVDSDTVTEMNKDVNRLSTIASRFSKIGSRPTLDEADLTEMTAGSVRYMSTRVAKTVNLTLESDGEPVVVAMSQPLLEWVLENLIKNAVDAMEGRGDIRVKLSKDAQKAVIDVTDTGKGISRKNIKNVFNPGFTTKKRGWGLGLTLAKRIVEEYHGGKIFVKSSTPGAGTTFTVEIPLLSMR
ncbi:MAG: HAMP domain-containing histidine kinase [Duncaniella sp.]|nr:HAMP domain-containing histidine kinase [Duncaniella sp.]